MTSAAEEFLRSARREPPWACDVTDPEEASEPAMLGLSSTSFVTYKVATRPYGVVRRRYSDFALLRESLKRRYAAAVLPLLPPAQYTGLLDPGLKCRRAAHLRRFLAALGEDPVLRRDALLRLFVSCAFWEDLRKSADDVEAAAARMDPATTFPCDAERAWADLLAAYAACDNAREGTVDAEAIVACVEARDARHARAAAATSVTTPW